MKIRFYLDLWPGIATPLQYGMSAHTIPYAPKSEGVKRVAFDVTIPDALLFEIDVVAPEVSKIDVVGK